MTRATFRHEGHSMVVRVEGHADYNPAGPDVVCAACSQLSYTLRRQIMRMMKAGELVEMHQRVEEGLFSIAATATEAAWYKLQVIADVIEGGFALLAKAYPENVVLQVSGFMFCKQHSCGQH